MRSNEDICNDIREFVSEFQFPEGHLPSFKELSQHGRFCFLLLCLSGSNLVVIVHHSVEKKRFYFRLGKVSQKLVMD